MSIKLYNSYKLPKMTMSRFFELIPELKKAVRSKQEEKFKDKFLKSCLELYDHKTLYPDAQVVFTKMYSQGSHSAASIIREQMTEEQKARKANDKMDDFYFHADFMFYRGRFYCVTHEMPNSNYHEAIQSVMSGELYEYWDNTDEPKEMTRTKWQRRRKEWENVFKSKSWDTSDPRSNAVRINFEFRIGYGVHSLIDSAVLTEKLLSETDRVKTFAENKVLNEWSSEVAPHPDENRDLKLNNLLDEEKGSKDKFQELWRYTFSDDFRQKRSAEVTRLQGLVKMDLSAQDVIKATYEVVRDLEKINKNNPNFVVHIDTL